MRVRTWDGAQAGAADGPTRGAVSAALRRLLWNPDEIGLARAWVAGEIDVEGDLEEALGRLETIGRDLAARRQLSPLERAEMLRAAVLLGAVGPAPKPPPEEIVLSGDNTPRAATAAVTTTTTSATSSTRSCSARR